MKQIIFHSCMLVGAMLSIGYFTMLQIASPCIFSFSFIWLFIGIGFLVLFIASIKYCLPKYRISHHGRHILAAGCTVILIFIGTTLCCILTPDVVPENFAVPYVIVLGGGVNHNGQLSDIPVQRLRTAAAYLRTNSNAIAIVSGGKGTFTPIPESLEMARVLMSFGIERDRIMQEDKALDTIENFTHSISLIADREGISIEEALHLPIVVITSDFHLARAERISRRCGFCNVYGLASSTPPLFILNAYCREILAYVKLNLRILLTGNPKRL